MPLIYSKAVNRYSKIVNSTNLTTMEIAGFIKCIARDRCQDGPNKIEALRDSLTKQFKDWGEVKVGDIESEKEALADLRNVAGILFLALKEEEEYGQIL